MMRRITASLAALMAIVGSVSAQTSRPALDPKTDSKAALTHRIPDVKITGVPLEQAIDFLRDVSGLNINVNWKALELLNVTKQTLVSVKLSDVPLRRVIKAVLDETGAGQALTYYVEDGIVEITTRELADAEMITRVYPVDDLVMIIPDFAGPSFNLQSQGNQTSGKGGGGSGGGQSLFGGGNGANASQQDTPASKQQRADGLVKMIRDTVKPEIWRENGGPASIRYFNGHLIVTAPRSVHEALGH
jgi:hypothetical protein